MRSSTDLHSRLHLLASPAFLLAVPLLVANDWIFKPQFPGLVTGKLSDFPGLFGLGFLVAALGPRQHVLPIEGDSLLGIAKARQWISRDSVINLSSVNRPLSLYVEADSLRCTGQVVVDVRVDNGLAFVALRAISVDYECGVRRRVDSLPQFFERFVIAPILQANR